MDGDEAPPPFRYPPPPGRLVDDEGRFAGYPPPPERTERPVAVRFLRSTGLKVTAGLVAIVAVAVLIGRYGDAERDDGGRVVAAGDLAIRSLRVGDCFDERNDEGVPATDTPLTAADPEVRAAPCDVLHEAEVFAVTQLAGAPGDDLPGDAVLLSSVKGRCDAAFTRYVGASPEGSGLVYVYFLPSEATWDRDDRRLTCAARRGDGQRQRGSIRGLGDAVADDATETT